MNPRLRLAAIALTLAATVVVWRSAGRVDDDARAIRSGLRVGADRSEAPAGEAATQPSGPDHDAAQAAKIDLVTATQPLPVAAPVPTAPPRMTPAQAREAMQLLRRERDCAQARQVQTGEGNDHRERLFWQWMPPEQVASERLGREAAASRMLQGCAPATEASTEESRRRHAQTTAAAILAGDTEARLRAWYKVRQQELASGQELSAERLVELRALLNETLVSGDLALIADLEHYERQLAMSQVGDPAGSALSMAWPLVACDLGLDCGASSRVLDRMCISRTSGACGAAGLEAAYRYTLHAAIFERIQARRAELLARIRSGQYDRIFDAPPTPPGGP